MTSISQLLLVIISIIVVASIAHAHARPRNVLIILTDQERSHQHWPPHFFERFMPHTAGLKKDGVSFDHAFTAATMCSPSRGVLFSSQFGVETGVKRTLDPLPPATRHTLRRYEEQPNLMSAINDEFFGNQNGNGNKKMAWKGKFHLSYSTNGLDRWSGADIDFMKRKYMLPGWNPPDAGTAEDGTAAQNLSFAMSTLGGGFANNDGRYIVGNRGGGGDENENENTNDKEVKGWGESALDFLRKFKLDKESYNGKQQQRHEGDGDASAGGDAPAFFLTLSLVNPHDAWIFSSFLEASGYADLFDPSKFPLSDIELPRNLHDNLSTKPAVQRMIRDAFNKAAPLNTTAAQREYAAFYFFLSTLVDKQIGKVINELKKLDLYEDTVILRTSDHGEMGMSHAGMRDKEYNVYSESVKIPLIISNPILFPSSSSSPRRISKKAVWSHLDLVPTILDLLRFLWSNSSRAASSSHKTNNNNNSSTSKIKQQENNFRGISQLPVILGEEEFVRRAALFSFDDQMFIPPSTPASHIRAVLTSRHTYAVYFNPNLKSDLFEFELYDNLVDELQLNNLLYRPDRANSTLMRLARELHDELTAMLVRDAALQPDFWPRWPKSPWW